MKKTVLITGAAGFVGRYVAKEFSNHGCEVIGMGWGKFPEYKDWGLSSWHESEISFESLCTFADKPDVIVHCAGGASVGNSVDYPRRDFCLTVDATSHLLEFIRLHSPQSRLIYPSSAAVYGQTKEVPIPETASFHPVSPYGVDKQIVEILCGMYSVRYGLSIVMVRLFSIYGEGLRKQLLWDACNKISSGDTNFYGSGEEIRDWLYISDAARLLRISSEYASTECPVVNGGSGIGLRVRDILKCICNSMNVEKELVFSSIHKDGDPDVLLADVSKVKAWGWHPEVEWEAAVQSYVRWFQSCR